MVLRFNTMGSHDDCCPQGHSVSATKASVQTALQAAYDLNSDDISVTMLGSYVILEGFVRQYGELERAIQISEDVVGAGQVRSRLMFRHM